MSQPLLQALRENILSVVVARPDVVDLALVALLAEGHLLIEDVPGIGKTTLAKAIARSIGSTFQRIQFTPDILPTDITGIYYFNQKLGDFEFRAGPVFAGLVLADEINRATPRAQSALLEAMEERQVTVEGETMPLPRPFLVIATQNPIELEGTFPLPEAQLDRFLFRLGLGYPDEADEERILTRFERRNPLADLAPVLSAEQLLELQAQTRSVHCEPDVRRYVVRLVRATRQHPAVELGASPRASLALYRAAQARALLAGRGYVLPDDVKALAPAALPHRLVLSSTAGLRGRTPASVVDDVLAAAVVPVEEEPARR